MKRLAFFALFLYAYLQALMTGTVVFQTFVMYPNIFRDPPESLSLSMDFFKAVAPGDFFPPFGAAIVITGVLCLIVSFRHKKSFYYFLGSVLLLFGGDGILSILYFWPRNEILFIEGPAKHSAETLQLVAAEFYRAHYLRLLTSTLASIAAMVGLVQAAFGVEWRSPQRGHNTGFI